MREVGLTKNELDTPYLWVDLDVMEQNIAWLAELSAKAGVHWRPHSKGIKVPAIIHKAMTAGAIGVTCAKLSEAEVMSAAGINDILIANQIPGRQKIRRLVQLSKQVDVKVAVDNLGNLKEIGRQAQAASAEVGVVVEIDLGMKRAGVAPGAAAVELSQAACDTPGIRYLGLMGWEGQASVITDRAQKEIAIRESVALLTNTARQCEDQGMTVSIVSAGGSATAEITSFIPGITEIQAGGAIFSDVLYQIRGVTNAPALFVCSTVSSRPTPDRIIFDAGFKALPAWSAQPHLLEVDDVQSVRMSAEHATVTLEKPDSSIETGDSFDFVVSYGDYTVPLHDQLYGIRAGVVETVWPIQGRGKFQ